MIDLFDANVFIGRPLKGIYRPAVSPDSLMEELSPLGISRALVWHIAQHDCAAQDGNRLINDAIASDERLYGSWTILPPATGEVIHGDFFSDMKHNRIAALRAFPDHHNYFLNKRVFGGFLDEISERRIPLVLSMLNHSEGGITRASVYQLLEDFPDLTCILCDLGVWNVSRYTWPLMESFPNLHLETSMISLGAGELESTVEHFGADRLVFGSGFPARYPQGAVLQLLHSGLSDADKGKIASLNLERLISRVQL